MRQSLPEVARLQLNIGRNVAHILDRVDRQIALDRGLEQLPSRVAHQKFGSRRDNLVHLFGGGFVGQVSLPVAIVQGRVPEALILH